MVIMPTASIGHIYWSWVWSEMKLFRGEIYSRSNLSKSDLSEVKLKIKTFRKVRRYVSENTALQLFKSTMLPIVDYNNIIYGLLTNQEETKLWRIQNRALETVFHGKVLNVAEKHNRAGQDTLDVCRNLHLMMLMYKCASNERYIDHTIRVMRRGTATFIRSSSAKPSNK